MRQLTLRKRLEWQIELLQLTEAERVLFEDDAIIEMREGRSRSAS